MASAATKAHAQRSKERNPTEAQKIIVPPPRAERVIKSSALKGKGTSGASTGG